MKVYTVHEPAEAADAVKVDRVDRGESLRFVADGFDWGAAIFAPFVLMAHRLWIGLAVYAVALALIVATLSAIGADSAWIGLAIAALHVMVGFEFGELLRGRYDAEGYADLGAVTGRNRAECERRFFADWLPRQPLIAGMGAPAELSGPATGPARREPAAAESSARGWLPWRH